MSLFLNLLFEQIAIPTHIYAYLLAKFGFDTAENEPCKVCPLSASPDPPGDPNTGEEHDCYAKTRPMYKLVSRQSRKCAQQLGVFIEMVDCECSGTACNSMVWEFMFFPEIVPWGHYMITTVGDPPQDPGSTARNCLRVGSLVERFGRRGTEQNELFQVGPM